MKFLKMVQALFTSAPRLAPADCMARVKAGTALLVDVRESGEWPGGVALFARLLPLSDLTGARALWKPFLTETGDREILVYCASGARSGLAARLLTAEGWRATNTGGLGEWREAGWALAKPSLAHPWPGPRRGSPARCDQLGSHASSLHAQPISPSMTNDILIIRSTALPLETVWQRLPEISVQHKFGVQASHNLREKMESKGVPFARECRVLEVCNPQHAQVALNQAIEISTALPCRIAVYTEGDRTVLATIKPTALLSMFNAPGAAATAREVEAAMIRIMDETCRG